MTPEKIIRFFDEQIAAWDLARKNFKDLDLTLKKPFKVGSLEGFVQCNPSRSVSTLAKVDSESLKTRKCFLCKENRGEVQKSYPLLGNWELLVNPYPILPYHFTICSINHTDQKFLFEEGVRIAEELPGFVVFYNDAGAGASAPDHKHFQAVPAKSLPLIKKLSEESNQEQFIKNLPFKIVTDREELEGSNYPLNVYIRIDDSEKAKVIGIPRKNHRPDCFFKSGPERRAFSPGAIDMAGIMVTPFVEDYYSTTNEDIADIYGQVSI